MFIGVDIGEIIRLCLCSDIQFVHVKCLEKSVNTRSIYHCRICDTSLPLKRKNKSIIKVNFERSENGILKENSRVNLKTENGKKNFSFENELLFCNSKNNVLTKNEQTYKRRKYQYLNIIRKNMSK